MRLSLEAKAALLKHFSMENSNERPGKSKFLKCLLLSRSFLHCSKKNPPLYRLVIKLTEKGECYLGISTNLEEQINLCKDFHYLKERAFFSSNDAEYGQFGQLMDLFLPKLNDIQLSGDYEAENGKDMFMKHIQLINEIKGNVRLDLFDFKNHGLNQVMFNNLTKPLAHLDCECDVFNLPIPEESKFQADDCQILFVSNLEQIQNILKIKPKKLHFSFLYCPEISNSTIPIIRDDPALFCHSLETLKLDLNYEDSCEKPVIHMLKAYCPNLKQLHIVRTYRDLMEFTFDLKTVAPIILNCRDKALDFRDYKDMFEKVQIDAIVKSYPFRFIADGQHMWKKVLVNDYPVFREATFETKTSQFLEYTVNVPTVEDGNFVFNFKAILNFRW